MQRTILLFLASALFLTACNKEDFDYSDIASADVATSSIYQRYEAEYDANTNTTRLSADLRKDDAFGRRVVLNNGAKLVFRNTVMTRDIANRGYVHYFNGPPSEDSLLLITNSGDTLVNIISRPQPVTSPNSDIWINKKQDFVFGLSGSGNGYTTVLRLGDKAFKETGTNRISISRYDLYGFGTGSYVASFVRSRNSALNTPTSAGGYITSRYVSYTFRVNIYE